MWALRVFGEVVTAAALAVAASGAAAQEAPQGPIPVTAFAQLPLMSNLVLAPDGRRIAATVYRDGRERIAVFAVGGTSAPTIIDAGEDNDVRGFQWAGNDRLLIRILTVARDRGLDISVTRVIVYDLVAQSALPIRVGHGVIGDDIIFIDPDGRYILLSSSPDVFTSPGVYRVDLATGTGETVQPRHIGVWNWFADAAGVVRAGVDYDESLLRIYYRATAESELHLIETSPVRRDDGVIDGIRFLEDTSRGVIISNAETGRFAVYEYDFATEARGATLFEHPEVDATAIIPGENGGIDGVLYEDDQPRVQWLNPEMGRLQHVIDRALPNKRNVILGRSTDNSRVLVWSGAADDPGTYYVYQPASRRIDAFAAAQEQLLESRLAPVRSIAYRSRDGLTIHGYLALPPGRPERGLPLIVMPHGGPFARDSWQFNAQVQFLASRGYAVLQPNFRGSTGYGRDFVARGFGQWGSGMIDDLDDGVAWLANQGIIDPDRICIMGGSYGGYAALWGAIRGATRYRCAISFAGVTDIRRLLRYDARSLIPTRYIRDWRRRVEGEERSDLDAISPLRQANRMHVPVLIAHGEKDWRVPVSHSRDMVRALSQSGAVVESVFYPEAGHGFSRPEDALDFLRRVEAFLARHNPADSPTNVEDAAASDGVPISPPSG
jgi:dipeptidyl aminopeptidase/acylaminoacyl peptidase